MLWRIRPRARALLRRTQKDPRMPLPAGTTPGPHRPGDVPSHSCPAFAPASAPASAPAFGSPATPDGAYEVPLPGGELVSDDRARLDVALVHAALAASYWAQGRERAVTERSLAHSLCFGLYAADGAQLGFARVVSDRATSAHLADVFVLEHARGRGLGAALVAAVLGCPELALVRRWTLQTRDAHKLYARFGFEPLATPERHMVR